MWLLALTYFSRKVVDSHLTFYRFGDFGFEGKSVFTVDFPVVGSPNLRYCLISKTSVDMYPNHVLPVSDICSDKTMDFPNHKIAHNRTLNGTISESGVYYQVIVNCDDPETTVIRTLVTVEERFKNPSTSMDMRWSGILKAKRISIGVASGFLLLWYANWLCHYYAKIGLHGMFTLVFTLTLIFECVRLVELECLNVEDSAGVVTTVRIVLGVIQNCALFVACAAVSVGFGILSEGRVSGGILHTMVMGSVWLITGLLLDFGQLGSFELAMQMITVLSSLLFVHSVCVNIGDTILRVWVHMTVISSSGINPRTTPIYSKYNKLAGFRILVILIAVVTFTLKVVTGYVSISFCVLEAVWSGLTILYMTLLGVLFALHSLDTSAGYCYVVQSEDSVDVEIDCELLDIGGVELKYSGTRWQIGMPLPREPDLKITGYDGSVFARVRSASLDLGQDPVLLVSEDQSM